MSIMINFKPIFFILLLVFSSLVFAENGLSPGFPHIGIWWPNPKMNNEENNTFSRKQSLAEVARYDFVTLFNDQGRYIKKLKQLNPQIILLNSTNACELYFSDIENDEKLSKIPAEWFLTQVGSTLSNYIDAEQSDIKVADLFVSDGDNVIALFEVGDTVLIEGESLKVTSINTVTKTLTVKRGFLRPASAHNAGTRIAAHISFWQNSWILNLSSLSPTATLEPDFPEERWSDYNARIGTKLLSHKDSEKNVYDWDGLLLDRVDPDQSWLVTENYARTIDPDQSNRLITDYSEFDKAWNEGLRYYQSTLRRLLGEDKILFTNWGIDNFPIINGNNYEAFPRKDGSSYKTSWHDTVFGKIKNIGSYMEWMEQGIQPKLTMIQTYEKDSPPEPGDLSPEENTACNPPFVPDYRKMRFGLTTTLLMDGYFSWEYSTYGHGFLCLKWFDEYDNVGQRLGYLGQPLGSAKQPEGLTLGSNQFLSDIYDDQGWRALWDFWFDKDSGYRAKISLDEEISKVFQDKKGNRKTFDASVAKINISRVSESKEDWQVALIYKPVAVENETEYTVSFMAKADRMRPISTWVQLDQDPRAVYFSKEVTLDTNWHRYEYTAKSKGSDSQAMFNIRFGQAKGQVWIGDIRIQKGSRDVWQRDFTGGRVLVNATNVAKTIELDHAFRKIKGIQDPHTNDGSTVTRVTIPPRDGLILLPAPPISPIILKEGSFDINRGWDFWYDTDSGYKAESNLSVNNNASSDLPVAQIKINQAPGLKEDWKVALTYRSIALEADVEYKISFRAKVFKEQVISTWAQMDHPAGTNYFSHHETRLKTGADGSSEWLYYEYTEKALGNDNQAMFNIGFGQTTGLVLIDDVRIIRVN